MTDLELGWLAGIIEGEGCIVLKKKNRSAAIQVNMTDFDIIRRLQQVTGVGRTYSKLARNERHKDQMSWVVMRREEVDPILRAIYPLMGERRRSRIEAALEHMHRPLRSVILPGEMHWASKLTDAQRQEIMSRCLSERAIDLAREFGVSDSTIRDYKRKVA